MTDALYSGQRFRALTILDEGNREGLAIEVATSIPSPRVVRVLEDLVVLHGRPRALRTDNGPEFTAQPVVDWCEAHGVALHYIQPGKPDQNAYIERFNRRYRTEVLDAYAFESITQVRDLTDACSTATTASGPTTASAGCRRSRFYRGGFCRDSLISDC
jgi:putative transposase